MSQLTFRSDIKVELIHHYGTDAHIAEAAWVSSGNDIEQPTEKRLKGVIRALLRDKHGTPFEAGYWCFQVEVPRAVRDEAVRHRVASFSASSLRYTMAMPEVYVPPSERPIKKAEGFKQIQPVYAPLTSEEYADYVEHMKQAYLAVDAITDQLRGIGREETEALRWLTFDGTYVRFHMRLNPRSLMHFLGLRTHNENANHISYPMWEIEQAALQMEAFFAEKLPITYAAWCEFGREAP